MVAGVFTTAIMAPGERIKCLMQVSSAMSELVHVIYMDMCVYDVFVCVCCACVHMYVCVCLCLCGLCVYACLCVSTVPGKYGN